MFFAVRPEVSLLDGSLLRAFLRVYISWLWAKMKPCIISQVVYRLESLKGLFNPV